MKNILIVDGATNCTYSLFAATDEEFAPLFPGDTDIKFAEEFFDRAGGEVATKITSELWKRPLDKKTVNGIHGTLFYQLAEKKGGITPQKRSRKWLLLALLAKR